MFFSQNTSNSNTQQMLFLLINPKLLLRKLEMSDISVEERAQKLYACYRHKKLLYSIVNNLLLWSLTKNLTDWTFLQMRECEQTNWIEIIKWWSEKNVTRDEKNLCEDLSHSLSLSVSLPLFYSIYLSLVESAISDWLITRCINAFMHNNYLGLRPKYLSSKYLYWSL